MTQIIKYKAKHLKTKELLVIHCEIRDIDYFKPSLVEIYCDKKALKKFDLPKRSDFLQSLLKNGKARFKIKYTKGKPQETIRRVLEREFGKAFSIKEIPIRSIGSYGGEKGSGGKRKRGLYQETKYFNADGLGDNYVHDKNAAEEYNKKSRGKKVKIGVFYATDRNRTNSVDPNNYYGGKRNSQNKLEYGLGYVSIPPKHRIGRIERPEWWKPVFLGFENDNKHIMIKEIYPKTEEDFLTTLKQNVFLSSKKDAFIFIHGYNVSFATAMRRTAQMKFDLAFEGIAMCYSWPSRSNLSGYGSDGDSSRWTVPHLGIAIKKVLESGIDKLHLIAHSMGTKALGDALNELSMQGCKLDKINQVILAAPDIDAGVVTDIIAPAVKGNSKQVTLYTSQKDKALGASRILRRRSGIKRAGQGGKEIIIVAGVNTVDATSVKTPYFDLGHGYFAETKQLINDLYLILEKYWSPEQRKLLKQTIPSKGHYWAFPKT